MIERLFEIFNISYIVSIMLLSYASIKIMQKLKVKMTKKWKRFTTFICGVVLGLLYYFIDNVTIQELIPSFLLSVTAYDYYFKAVLKKLKVGYKHDE